MNLETVNLDNYLARNLLPRFAADIEAAHRDAMEKDKQEELDEYEA